MRKLNLHIGTHKTATTSIQHFLSANRDELRSCGLFYPRNSLGGFPDHHTHHHVAHAMAGKQNQGTPKDARRFFDCLKEEMKEGETAVVSAESMYRHVLPHARRPADNISDTKWHIAGDPLGYIQAVRECLVDFDVTVMVMLRRQDSFLESLYAETVLNSGYGEAIPEFVRLRGWLADYDGRLGMWGKVFGHENISVRVFDPSKFGESTERYFIEWAGGEWSDQFKLVGKRNVTVPRALVEYKRMINGDEPKRVSTTYRRWLELLAGRESSDWLPDIGRHYFSSSDRFHVLEQFADGNRRVAQRFFGRDALFEGPSSEDSIGDPAELSAEAFQRITKMLFRTVAERELRSSVRR